jgi:type II secretory pathway component GspD/PulD (secretin)
MIYLRGHFKFLYALLAAYFILCPADILWAEDANAQLAQAIAGPDLVTSAPSEIQSKVSLDLRNIDVVDALKFLAMKASLNIVVTKNVSGKITLMVENVPVKDIFDIMLRSNELAYAKEGNIYNVMTEDEYKMLFGKRFSDSRKVKIFQIRYAIPEQVFTLFDTLKSEIGRVLIEPESGTALILDTPERVNEIEKALVSLEQKNTVKVFRLQYAKAKEVEDQLKSHIDAKKVGFVRADERSNQIIVQALPDRMPDIEKLVAALDRKTKEVLIDTKIVKVKLSNASSEGIEWEGLSNLFGKGGSSYIGSYPFSVLQAATDGWQSRNTFKESGGVSASSTGTPLSGVGAYPFSGNTASTASSTKTTLGEKMHLGIITRNRDIDILLNYIRTLGNTQILSNPKLAVINNQEARIHVGERQAYVTTTTTTGQSTSTVSEEVTFVDVGIQLAVTPTINDDGYITMKVKPEISSVVSSLTTPSGNKIPIIDSSMAETTVMVKDGSTIIIGGLRKDEKISSYEQMPVLGKIPILNFLFKSGTKSTERTELLVMLTPHIVTGDTLFTGDEREIENQPGKDYVDYSGFTSDTDLKPLNTPLESNIKPYKDYSDIKDKNEARPIIKGEDGYE